MAEHATLVDRWGRDSPLYGRYTSRARAALDSNATLQQAEATWAQFFRDSHGDVFDGLPFENPVRKLFVDTLYYDFVVDQLLAYAERTFDFELANPEVTYNTDALDIDFRSLHGDIVDVDSVATEFDGALSRGTLLSADSTFLRTLYEGIISRELRLALGEYYTPRGLAQLAVEQLTVDSYETETFLDPGCGSGIFLAACIDATREALADQQEPDELLATITDTVYGIDLNPVAVKSAKLSYLLSILPLLDQTDREEIELPVFLTDALALTREDDITFRGQSLSLTVDHLVGNPPWITWGNLSSSLKDAWRETYTEQLDLLPHRGIDSRLGHGNDDISVPFIWVCLDRYLAEGGDASFVLKRDIMKGPAGRLLRTQQVGGRPVAVRHIHDFNTLSPFGESVSAHTATYTLEADRPPADSIPTTSWTMGDGSPDYSTADTIRETLTAEQTDMIPVDADDQSSSWVRSDAEHRALGTCAHDIRHGVKDDATAVYSIDREQLDTLEPDHVYPYLKSRHVVKYGLFGHELHLVPLSKANEDNEAQLREECPRTYQYLCDHREALDDRSSSWLDNGPFYNVFGLGEYTWKPYKVVWCRLGFKPHFTVVSTVEDDDLGEKLVVPGDHCMFIATDRKEEAHFLCGLLNSAIYQQSIEGIASEGKASLSKSVISKLELPEYRETERTRRLAELSMEAHEVVPEHTDVSKRAYNSTTIEELELLQAEIDRVVEELLAEGTLSSDTGANPVIQQ